MSEELVTLACTEEGCSETFTGPDNGRGSARWQLGSHKYRVHKIAGNRSHKKGAGRKAAQDEQEFRDRPVLAVVQDVAGELGSGKAPPSADELKKGLGRGLGYVSVAVASYAVETDPTIAEGPAGDAERDSLVDNLSLTQKGAEEIMAPLGRFIAPTAINRRFGRHVVENVDAVAAVAELVTLGLRWRRYFAQRRYRLERMQPIEAHSTPLAPMVPAPGVPIDEPFVVAAAHAAPVVFPPPRAPATNGASPDLGGVVMTPDMIAGMEGRRRGA